VHKNLTNVSSKAPNHGWFCLNIGGATKKSIVAAMDVEVLYGMRRGMDR
jgi:hypothetical protein